MLKRDSLPSLDLLKAFEVSARHLSFTKAGGDLFLSQSAVSRQIQLLEAQLGVALFHRRTRALQLTEKGRLYYNEISRLLERLRDATTRITESPSGNTLTVTTAFTFASLWLVPRLSALQIKHPGLRVQLAADNRIQDLKREHFDVAIRYSTRKTAGPGAQKLFGENTVPVCAPKLRSANPLKNPEGLQDFVLLHFEDIDGRAPWLSWRYWFDATKTREVIGRGSMQFSHYDQALRAAIAGQGVALGRMPLIKDMLDSGQLVMPFKSKRYAVPTEDRAYWLIVSPAAAARDEVKIFAAWLKAEAAAGIVS